MSTFKTKKVWHSGLKYGSPLVVQFGTGQIVDSKYDEEAKLIYFTVRGDETEYYYQIENDQLARDLEAVVAKAWYSLEADGMKEDATLTLTPIEEGSLPAITTSTAPAAVSRLAGTGAPPKQASPGEFNTGSHEGNMLACMEAAARVFGSTFAVGLNDGSEADRGIIERLAVSLFIQANMNRFVLPITATDEGDAGGDAPVLEDAGPDLTGLKELAAGLTMQSGMSHDGKQLKRALDSIAASETMTDEAHQKAMAWVLAEGEAQDGTDDGEDDLPF